MPRERGDQELVELTRGGNSSAAEVLFSRHLRQAWAAAFAISGCRHVSDDALQDGVERAIRNLGRFDASRPFAPWFTRIVVNGTLDIMRRRRNLPEQSLDELHEESMAGRETDGLPLELGMALDQLTPERRATVVLRLVVGLGAGEVAELTGAPEGTVNSRLSRALGELRAILSGEP